jgi:hypothetical protein
MKRSTKPWTLVLAAALIALPASGISQTLRQDPPTPPPSAQPPATPQPPATTPPATAAEQHQAHSPAEHLAKAKAALNEVETTAITGDARTKLTELKRHMASLDRAAAAADKGAPSATPKTTRAKPAANWATDVAAIDRILTDLTTPMTPGDPAPPTGTTGTTGTTGGSTSRAKTAITIDEATRAKLLEMRTHITAFAAAMSGSPAPSTPKDMPTTAPPDPPMPATPPTPPPATTTPPTEPPVTTQPPTTPPAAQPPTTTPPPPTTPTDPSAPAPASESGTVDEDAAKRHLTEARDTLSQITQLPEAAQLTGDARTQVSELITNFNELITTQTEWRANYAKLQKNLTALVGAETSDEPPVTPPATGEPGAVGTSGMTTLDPKIREKLIEFRSKLAAFERAAGGSGGTPK